MVVHIAAVYIIATCTSLQTCSLSGLLWEILLHKRAVGCSTLLGGIVIPGYRLHCACLCCVVRACVFDFFFVNGALAFLDFFFFVLLSQCQGGLPPLFVLFPPRQADGGPSRDVGEAARETEIVVPRRRVAAEGWGLDDRQRDRHGAFVLSDV